MLRAGPQRDSCGQVRHLHARVIYDQEFHRLPAFCRHQPDAIHLNVFLERIVVCCFAAASFAAVELCRPHQKIGDAEDSKYSGEGQKGYNPRRPASRLLREAARRGRTFQLLRFAYRNRRRRGLVLRRRWRRGRFLLRLVLLRRLILLRRLLILWRWRGLLLRLPVLRRWRPILRLRHWLLRRLRLPVLWWRLLLDVLRWRRRWWIRLILLRGRLLGRCVGIRPRRRSLGGWRETIRAFRLRWRHLMPTAGTDPTKHIFTVYEAPVQCVTSLPLKRLNG